VTTISTDYLFTGVGDPLKDAFVSFDEQGTILNYGFCQPDIIINKYYPGAICPGFINAHIHTELSHIRYSKIAESGSGMASFINSVAGVRFKTSIEDRRKEIENIISYLFKQGVTGMGDICNEAVSFSLKHDIPIKWHHFIECFGTNPDTAEETAKKAEQIYLTSKNLRFQSSITPHATYSMSSALFKYLNDNLIKKNDMLSFHFMESPEEIELLTTRSGRLTDLFKEWGIQTDYLPESIKSPLDLIMESLPMENRLLFVHNTFIDKISLITILEKFSDPWFCLCPVSNLSITGYLPPVDLLRSNTDKIVIGTDSTASNNYLSMIEEIRVIQKFYPVIPFHELVTWATRNGALFFGWDKLGKIAIGGTPGLVWIEGFIQPDIPLSKNAITNRIV